MVKDRNRGMFVKGSKTASELGSLGGSKPTTKPKGFAAMSPEKRRLAAKRGGLNSKRKATHAR